MARFPEHPDTRVFTTALLALAPGAMLTYEAAGEMIGSPVNGSDARLWTARRRAESEDGYVFSTERGVGVRRLRDSEIASQGGYLAGKMRRAARRAEHRSTNVGDWASLSPEDKARVSGARALFGALRVFSGQKALERIEAASSGDPLSINRTLALFGRAD